ncbi:MAG: aminoglycoside phosphotransferase family protein [archaeon GB-1867-005]|nr:aminoglycoside phosphotransferase family protein [Candidatus Culexmicrobium cathedralense]
MLTLKNLESYLSEVYCGKVKIIGIGELGEKIEEAKKLKGFGYGKPYIIKFEVNGAAREVVLSTVKPSIFDHQHFSDRARILLWQHHAFNKLPKHVKSIDVGAFTVNGKMISLGKCIEFFILTEKVEGTLYHVDLDRIKARGELSNLDIERCKALAKYLVDIHRVKGTDPSLYHRRIRELIGHGECIMGLIDSYPTNLSYVNQQFFIEVERKCIEWRWKLKRKAHRLSQVHGDYHPWNIMFREGTKFSLLDRSRGEWGEPADDVTALTINYIFYSLQAHGRLEGAFERLFKIFWETYLNSTGDDEILQVVQPFYAWRGLVVASPIWYPTLPLEVRAKLLNFIKNVLQTEKFDIKDVNQYLEEN